MCPRLSVASRRPIPQSGRNRRSRHRVIRNAPRQLEPLEARLLLAASIPSALSPVARWAFDEGTGTSAANAAGPAYTATLGAGVSWSAGNVGTHAVNVTGTANGSATVTGPVVDTSASFTVSAWVNLTNLTGFQTFVSIAGASVAGFFLQLRGNTGTFAFTRLASDSTAAATTYVSAPTAPMAGTWYHLVGVNDAVNNTLSLYVDGRAAGSTPYSAGWKASGDTLIGHGFYNGGRTDYVRGAIDDVEFYAAALSSEQVAALDQPAAYTFDEGAGTVANDVSGHGHIQVLGPAAGWAAGQVGPSSIAINGTAASIAANPAPAVNTALPFSVSAWVKLNAVNGTQTFASIDGLNASGFALQLRADTGKFAFTRLASDSSAAQSFHADALTAPSAGIWYQLIGVNNPARGQLQLYVNGILQSTVSYAGGWQATGATVTGAGLVNGIRSEFTNGLIDDLRFYDSPLSALVAGFIGTGGNSIITINPAVMGPTVSPALFGAFMEDINYGGEGGVYNNLVRNSGFNDSTNALRAWAALAGAGVATALTSDDTTGPTSALTKSGKLAIASGVSATARAGISNSGYFGVAVAPSTTYTVDFYAKATAGFTGPLTVALESNTGTIWASATVASITTSWAKYSVTLTTPAGTPLSSTNKIVIFTNSPSANGDTIWFGATYVYPPSYKNSPAHLRIDLMEMLDALKPATFRVPGGNYLEGNTYADRFNWSQTIGPVETRPGHFNSAWGYWSTDGMGLDEYLQMAELVNAEPILGVYAGYTLNGQSDTGDVLLADVQDALNELHYVLDPITTPWGALRAANGHPAPYNINMVEIGNEDWFSSTYPVRYPLFYDAIRAEFPQLKIIASHTATGGRPYDILDEHYYNSPQWFIANATRYDNATRGSYKIFVGEYGANTGTPTNDMASGLGDAAFLLGCERNSDLVTMTAYAPLWANVNGIQWDPDLIGFNNISSYGSPSYWAQVMLNNHKGTQVVGSTLAGASGLVTLVTRAADTFFLTVINSLGTPNDTTINLNGLTTVSPTGTLMTLSATSGAATNSISNPTNIVPISSVFSGLAPSFSYTFPAYSLTILEFTASASPPRIVNPASATPGPVTGKTTGLSALGDDDTGEARLTYTWSAVGTPPAPVTFAANGTNAAKNTIATFTQPGTYNLSVAITNAAGLAVTSAITVIVEQTLAGLALSPALLTIPAGGSTPFAVHGTDQFGNPMATLSGVTWSVHAGAGSIDASGLFTAPAGGGGITTVRAVTPSGTVLFNNVTILSEVAWYPANAPSGTTLADSSGNASNAILTGNAAFTAGVSGNALTLSGGYASLPAGIVSALDDFTIAAWIKVSSLASWSRIFDFGTGTTANMFLTPAPAGANALRFAITTSGGGGEQRLLGPSLTLGAWTHIAITLAGNTATLYINGSPAAANANMTLRPSSLGNTTQNYLGRSQYASDAAFQGSIDDFRIVGRALSAAEVLQLAQPVFLATPFPASNPGGTSGISLSALAADATAGQAGLIYTWSLAGTNPGTAVFSANGTNAARNTSAVFSIPGVYTLQVTAVNPIANLPVASQTFTVTAQHPGDANGDGKVDATDLNMLAAHWQQASGATWTTGDFTGDGEVNVFDLNVLAEHWQYGTAGKSLMPALTAAPVLTSTAPAPASAAPPGPTPTNTNRSVVDPVIPTVTTRMGPFASPAASLGPRIAVRLPITPAILTKSPPSHPASSSAPARSQPKAPIFSPRGNVLAKLPFLSSLLKR